MSYETTSRHRILEYENSGKPRGDPQATDFGEPWPAEEPFKRRASTIPNVAKAVALLVVVAVLCVVFFSVGERISEQRITRNLLSTSQAGTPPVNPETASSSSASRAAPGPEQKTPQASQPPVAVALKREPSPTPGSIQRTVVLQVAALTRQEGASTMAAMLQARQYPAFVRLPATDNFYRVQVGPYPDLRSANAVKRSLERAGYEVVIKR
jgi:cell division septation protein DedD